MLHFSRIGYGFPVEILQLILDNLVGDTNTLARVGLASRSWRTLSLPFLLKDVDLSSHNMGQTVDYDGCSLRFYSDVDTVYCSDEYRPRSLVPRQRAFLRLMTDRPELIMHVKALTWTLVWIDFDEDDLTDIDLQAWDVFGRMQNVTRLDLASLHNIGDQPYIRQNPARLFPAVTDLRLVGWMHRGLVKAIVTSLDASKLRSLKLDHLQDEGALPNGAPIPQDIVITYSPYHEVDPYDNEGIDDKLWARQERGGVVTFPGPMWSPLRFLRRRCLSSMAHLQIRLGPLNANLDLRNDITMFRETVEFIQSAKDTLETIFIGLGEYPSLHRNYRGQPTLCGTAQMRSRLFNRSVCFDLTSAFLHRLLPALTEERFPHLAEVDLVGFDIIRNGTSQVAVPPDPGLTWEYIRNCPFVDESFTENVNIDESQPFTGYDYDPEIDQDMIRELEEIVES
ncbi:hypothetical protein F4820DRAFT_465555 [Hypoxylon rubiginosum]|uniref:Uncharacterized protein n=1 Tax=Hypoxylon rubiginosum TaxID=110542 RepID=A0ACB9YMG8_9PEZI|nr:hypothetical protein F4820DRAFT_465555 [Hypoxylon rubiginosum]